MPEPQTTKQTPNAAPPVAVKPWRWITSNVERVLGFAEPPKTSAVSKIPVADSKPLAIPPGASLVDNRKWAALKAAEDKASKAMREAGLDPEIGEITRLLTTKVPKGHAKRPNEMAGSYFLVEGPEVANRATPLADLTEDQAVAIVAELRDFAMVNDLLAIERRPTVAEALRRNRDELAPGWQRGAVV